MRYRTPAHPRFIRRGTAGRYLVLTLALMGAEGLPGCAANPGAASMTNFAGGTKVAAVEPFGVVRPMDGGQTYLRVDEAKARRYGAVFNVNGGEWVQSALVRRGDRVTVAYARPGGVEGAAATGTLGYDVWGHTTRNYVRFTEHRWYLDGFGAEERALRVVPYGELLGPPESPESPAPEKTVASQPVTGSDRSAEVPTARRDAAW